MHALALRPSPAPLIRTADAERAGRYPHKDGDLHRVRPGVYTRREDWDGLAPWDRYLARVHAYALIRPDAIFSHESAAALLGLPLFGHPLRIHVFDDRRSRSLAHGDVIAHTSADARRCTTVEGRRISRPVDAVVDLARALPPAFGLSVADAASRRFDVTPDWVRETMSAQRSIRGRRRVEWVCEHMTGDSESVAESVSRAVAHWHGFPEPLLQAEHRVAGRVYRSDFCWPEFRVLGEVDGWMKYSDDDPADAAMTVRNEKRREDALRRAGWRIARWDYAGALRGDGPYDALRAAGLPLVRPADTAQLLGIGRNPRSR
ncbi:MAG: hypothetical protein BGO45_14115 [Microbacterium sp. 71-36]|uniref:type IV toxin-antitoxin system AbiEi family antitoxin domain-containing protein n=1 Tax=unclassified Microbacterium TaxID=2609290 RepID=UPI00086BFD39|nr:MULTISPECIES: hypothetical protein [unclassified Microbacterium]MBN9212475.1 hypothetical protein [Microbacterium sp.]ODT39243.1 MAG: hypothetical protein ABS60_07210 [Microbacterium sp. SCN 71-17]OJV77842.1 MAG: hypothetical protein BGO45_14115 [Microbacterium sp. 71-36]